MPRRLARSRSRLAAPLLTALLLAAAAAACGGDDGAGPPPALTSPELDEGALGVPVRGIEVVRTIPHATDAWTQGLLWHDGRLYESTGLVGQSSLRVLDPADGREVDRQPVDPALYAEGLARVDDRLVQLTWKDGVAPVYDVSTLSTIGELEYEGEGWGLCSDGERLVMSDGSADLAFRDPDTFEESGRVTVELDGDPVDQLNELECVEGRVYANVWHTDSIVEIDPETGAVTSVVDASALAERLDPAPASPEAVLNGIAHDPDRGTFWLTGKLWPQLFEVRLEAPEP